MANASTAHFTPGLHSSLTKIPFNIAYREILRKWQFSGRLCSTSGFGELAPGRLVISLALVMKGCWVFFWRLWIKKEGSGKRMEWFGSVQLPDVLRVTARGGRSTCKRVLGMVGDAGSIGDMGDADLSFSSCL